jgi:predicted RNA-binding protein
VEDVFLIDVDVEHLVARLDVLGQKVMEHFRGAVKKWEEQDQKLMIQTAQLFETMSSVKQQEKEEKKIWDKVKKVYAQQDVLRLKSAPVIIKIMQETEVTLVWIKKLNELSYLYKFNAGFKQKAEVVALYNRLSEKDKELDCVKDLTVRLFPPTVVEVGDDMADADLYDVNGKIHHLSDFKGKYILIDFWSQGCAPCLQSLPELKEITSRNFLMNKLKKWVNLAFWE